jgi:pantoate--beta-alanine ligase
VVNRLLRIVRPDVALFGQKDYQQFRVIEAMTRREFGKTPHIVPCLTVREPEGIAMSSRNRNLSKEDRRKALRLIRSLRLGRKLIREGRLSAAAVRRRLLDSLAKAGIREIDYLEIVDPKTLKNVLQLSSNREVLIAAAVRINNTRLIDNLIVKIG